MSSLFFVADHYFNHTINRYASTETKQLLYTQVLGSLLRAANKMEEESDDELGIGRWSGTRRSPHHLLHFARILRHFMLDPDIASSALLFCQQELLDLLIQYDMKDSMYDEDKHELCKLWTQLLQQFPEMVHWTAINESAQGLLLNFNIHLNCNSEPLKYNNAALLPFYQVVNMCCDHKAFRDLFAMHPASDWMILHLFLKDDEYRSLETTLYAIINKCTASTMHRHKIIEAVLGFNESEQKEKHDALLDIDDPGTVYSVLFFLWFFFLSDLVYFQKAIISTMIWTRFWL